MTGMQIRMARAALRWSMADLSAAAGIARSTLQQIEAADGAPGVDAGGLATTREHREGERAESLAKITAALEGAGVTFLPDDGKHGPGIRGRTKKGK